MTSRPRRPLLALVLLLSFAAAGCSDDDGDDAATSVPPDGSEEVGSDLVREGEQDCDDEEGDVTVAAAADVPPSVEQPGIDILGVHTELDQQFLTIEYSVAGALEPEAEPDFIMSVGLLDDVGGFEVHLRNDEGTWIAEVAVRQEGTASTPVIIPGADVRAQAAVLTAQIPVRALPDIAQDKPLLFGSSGLIRDGDSFLDSRGQPVDDPADADRVIDDCIEFGQ
jgi:hypothetical protein